MNGTKRMIVFDIKVAVNVRSMMKGNKNCKSRASKLSRNGKLYCIHLVVCKSKRRRGDERCRDFHGIIQNGKTTYEFLCVVAALDPGAFGTSGANPLLGNPLPPKCQSTSGSTATRLRNEWVCDTLCQ